MQDRIIELLRQVSAGTPIASADEVLLQRDGLIDVIETFPVTIELTLRGKRMLREGEPSNGAAAQPVTLRVEAEIAGGNDATMTAVHEIRQDGDDVIAAECWTDASGEVQRHEVRLPFSQFVHLALNTTAKERAAVDARADWRGVDAVPDAPVTLTRKEAEDRLLDLTAQARQMVDLDNPKECLRSFDTCLLGGPPDVYKARDILRAYVAHQDSVLGLLTTHAPAKDERAWAERWARAYLDAVGCEQDADEGTIAAMLPLVREAAADRDKWRQLAEFSEAEADRCRAQRDEAEGLNENERDTAARATAELAEARREIERLRASRDQWMGLAELSGTAIERLARSTTAPVNPPKILDSSAPLTEADHGPLEDEALRWAEDVLDAAKPPEEADLDMSAAARAISPLVREAQAARRAPLTKAEAQRWADMVESTDDGTWLALYNLSRGDIPAEVRADHADGATVTATPDHAPTLTREEAMARIRAISPTAVHHVNTAREWLAAYKLSPYRDPLRDEMAKILRAYVAGLDTQNGGPK